MVSNYKLQNWQVIFKSKRVQNFIGNFSLINIFGTFEMSSILIFWFKMVPYALVEILWSLLFYIFDDYFRETTNIATKNVEQ